MAEIQAFKTGMSEKHRTCHKITKYLTEVSMGLFVNKYFMNNAVLQHKSTCLDTSDDYTDCVIKVYQDILNAYKRMDFCRIIPTLTYFQTLTMLSVG